MLLSGVTSLSLIGAGGRILLSLNSFPPSLR
jgi:hypothetical protein